MNYYKIGLGLLYDYAGTLDTADQDAAFDELMDAALGIAVRFVSWGVADERAFYLAARRVVGSD